jgi:hypothetical protein
MSEMKFVKRYENDDDLMIEITHDFRSRMVTVKIDDSNEEGHVASIRIPEDIWEQMT